MIPSGHTKQHFSVSVGSRVQSAITVPVGNTPSVFCQGTCVGKAQSLWFVNINRRSQEFAYTRQKASLKSLSI